MSKTRLNIELAASTMLILDALVARRPGQTRTSMIAMSIHDAFDALPPAARREIDAKLQRVANPYTREGAAALGIDYEKVMRAETWEQVNALTPEERDWLDNMPGSNKIVE